MNKHLHGLYAITDPLLCKDNLLSAVEQAISGGAQIIQYRNKPASPQQKRDEATAINALCQQQQRLFIINDDVELAKEVNASGVHIGQNDSSIMKARETLGKEKIIGVTCNNQMPWALDAEKAGADYVAFGRFFSSQTKPDAPQASIELLIQAQQQLTIPIAAIGGITPATTRSLIEAGADMIAVIHGLFSRQDIAAAARQFQQQFYT